MKKLDKRGYKNIAWVSLGVFLLTGCTGKHQKELTTTGSTRDISVVVPDFNADSAYFFTKRQVEYGPRIPNTKAHEQTYAYLKRKLESYGHGVSTQSFTAPTYDGKTLQLKNIIAQFAPQKKKRVLLAAHWDTRPKADKDPYRPEATFDGANDGASGVGVLLEIARLLSGSLKPGVGVDIVLFDGEDWGPSDSASPPPVPAGWDSWWCLGSQYWSKEAARAGYTAYYGLVLDMVGAKQAVFYKEGSSIELAPRIVDKVWQRAAGLGYGGYFVDRPATSITDDHVYVNLWAKIPTIDIVHYDVERGYFASYHHTQKDNLALISPETLKAIGQTIVAVVYNETEE